MNVPTRLVTKMGHFCKAACLSLSMLGMAGVAQAQPEVELEAVDASAAPASKTLERGLKFFKDRDYYSASIELKKVVDGKSGDDDFGKQKAEYYLGRTMYDLKLYAGALAYFDRIVEAGDAHAFHGATLKYLARLAKALPETAGIYTRIGTYSETAFESPALEDVRDELIYLQGRHFYRKGDVDKALEMFGRVREDSVVWLRAKFFQGVTLAARKFDGPAALEAFQSILVVGEERGAFISSVRKRLKGADAKEWSEAAINKEITQFVELTNLQLGRVFYSVRDYDKAIKYFEKIPQISIDWPLALFEASWAYFMKNMNDKALGNIHSLGAPYFENEFFPEATILRAVIYYQYCLYDRALEAVADYNDKYGPLKKNLIEIAGKYEDQADFYAYIGKVRAGKGGIDKPTERLLLSALRDRTVAKSFEWVDELDRELKAIDRADKSWQSTAIATEVQQELEVQKSLAEASAGKLSRTRIDSLIAELSELSLQGTRIRIEVLGAQAGAVTGEAREELVAGATRSPKIEIDDEHFAWKFRGEYWRDELGYYRFRIESKCKK
ncbi:MAG: hypothetical protein IPL79_06700 [Myxococcales bacterium]|nr:hypothetical protein [Myxococcales bacterium]